MSVGGVSVKKKKECGTRGYQTDAHSPGLKLPLKALEQGAHHVLLAHGKVVQALCVFFFQAEDGIRDGRVTGVQTCALPISEGPSFGTAPAGTCRWMSCSR